MAYILKKIGNVSNIPAYHFECDNNEDILEIPLAGVPMSSTCYVINEGTMYTLNSEREWIITMRGGTGGNGGNSGGAASENSLHVYITYDYGPDEYTANKTFEEILTASRVGSVTATVERTDSGYPIKQYQLTVCRDNEAGYAIFTRPLIDYNTHDDNNNNMDSFYYIEGVVITRDGSISTRTYYLVVE